MSRYANDKILLTGFILFILFLISITIFRENIQTIEVTKLYYKAAKFSILSFSRIMLATTGLLFFYMLVNHLIINRHYIIPQWMVNLNPICFGVYLYHQFILQFLYYEISFPKIFGTYWLPIVGFVITAIVSIILSKLTLKTKIGRILIG